MSGHPPAPLLPHWARRLLPLALLVSMPLLGELKPGFRDLKWGDRPTPAMSVFKKKGDTALYQRHADKLTVGNVAVSQIIYGFYNGRLDFVQVRAPASAFSDLLTILKVQWGEPLQPNQFIKTYYIWHSNDQALGETLASIEQTFREVTIVIFSKDVHDEKEAEKKAAAKKAKDDL